MPTFPRSINRQSDAAFPEWDEDVYSISDADEEAEFRREQQARPDASAPPNAIDRMKRAGDRQAQHEASRPQASQFQPKGWQRALAGAANFATGYVNAGGRVRVDPQATRNINQSLLQPGYAKAQQKWQDEGIATDAEMRGATRDYQIDTAQAKAKQDADRAKAYEEAQGSTASLARRREAKLNEPPPPFINSPIGPVSRTTGELINKKEPGKPLPETPIESQARRAKEIESGQFKSLTPEQRESYVLTGRIPAKPRPQTPRAGKSGPKPATPLQNEAFDSRIKKEYALAEKDALKELAALKNVTEFATGDDPWLVHNEAEGVKVNSVKAKLAQRKKDIASRYDSGVVARGGSVIPRGGDAPPPPPSDQGKIAVNPQTGEKLRFDKATRSWVPL